MEGETTRGRNDSGRNDSGRTGKWAKRPVTLPNGDFRLFNKQVWKYFALEYITVNNCTHLSRLMTKPTKWYVRPAKTQISLGIRPVWSESSLCAQWVAKDPSFLLADSEDSDQTGRMPRLIWVFAGRTVILLVLSWGGSFGFLCIPQKIKVYI